MKKLGVLLLALSLIGCAKIEEALEINQEEEVVEEEQPEQEETSVYSKVWAVAPEIEVDNVKMMMPFDKQEVSVDGTTALVDLNKIGYPQQWASDEYDCDAVIVAIDGNHGIYNYEAKAIYPASVSIHSAPFAQGIGPARVTTDDGVKIMYGAGNTQNDTAFYFTDDYKTIRDVPSKNYEYDPYDTETKTSFVAIKDNKLGVATPQGKGNYTFTATSASFPSEFVAPVLDGNYHITDYKVCDKDGNVVAGIISGNGPYNEGSYINGFYTIGTPDAKTLVNATGEYAIGDYSYQAVGYFSDGYCPVKKYGKWGYIDENGDEVTDFIFDNATSLYDGKAYVLYGGVYGVLDIKGSIENDIPLTLATCYHIPQGEEPIGVLEVHVKELTIRGGAGPEYASVGNSHIGAKYNVFEIKEVSGYTWYRISNYSWIPSDGDWTTYTKGEKLVY